MNKNKGRISSQTIGWLAWSGASTVFLQVVGIGSIAVLARLLTQEDYGVFAAALIFIGLVRSGLVQGGFPTAMIQRQDLTPLHIRNAFTGTVILHVVAGVLIWVGSDALALFFKMPELSDVLKAMCIIVAINPFYSVSSALLRRRKRFRVIALSDMISSIFANTAVAIVLALYGFGVWSLVISNISWAVVQTVVMYAIARFNPLPAITSHMRDLLSLSMGFTFGALLAMLAEQAPKFAIGRLLGADVLGVYNRSNRLMSFPITLLGATSVLFPVMSDMNDDMARMARGYLRAVSLCTLVVAPLTVLLCHAAEGFILLLLGDRWIAAIEPTAILSLTLVFALSLKMANIVFMAMGKIRAIAIRQASFAAFIVVGSVAGSRWGLEGVCVAILLAYIGCYVISLHLANRLLDVGWLDFAKANVPGLSLALPVLVALVLGETFIWHDAPKYLLFPIEAAVTGFVIYAACVIKPSWFLGADGVWLLSELRQRAPRRLRALIPGVRAELP